NDDNNPCTKDSCVTGTPQHIPDPSKPCGTNGICNSSGQCVGCTQPTDCAGTDDFCKTRTCVNQTCGFNYTAANTPLPSGSQVAGDCATLVCDGNGATQKIANSSDVFNDNKECTDDTCVGTTPQNTPKSAGDPCTSSGGKVCDGAGACVACLVAAN